MVVKLSYDKKLMVFVKLTRECVMVYWCLVATIRDFKSIYNFFLKKMHNQMSLWLK